MPAERKISVATGVDSTPTAGLFQSVNVSSYVVCYNPRKEALVRFFCFPHGGGGPQIYRSWALSLPEYIEVYSINLPGRGSRQAEEAIHDINLLSTWIVEALKFYLDKPYALFGHSVGALVCYEVVQLLSTQNIQLPLHVFFSAHAAPHLSKSSSDTAMHKLSDSELSKIISSLGLIPPEILENEQLLDMLLPPIRADFALSENYAYHPKSPFKINISVLGGEHDEILQMTDLQNWSSYTTQEFQLKSFDGGHFYTQTHEAELLTFIEETLSRELKSLPPSILLGKCEPYPKDKCLHELFKEQATKTPDSIAAVDIHKRLTFKELDELTDLLALYLVSEGAGMEKAVGIYMEHSVEYIVAYLAILKAGGGYLPIETAYPLKLLEKTIKTAKPVVILTKKPHHHNLPRETKHFELNDNWIEILKRKKFDGIQHNIDDHHVDMPAYFIMTSGTTGVPKGIRCPHRGATNSYNWRYVSHPYHPGDHEAANVFFVWEVMRPILKGIPAYVIPDDVIYDPRRLVAFLKEFRITRVLLTPSLLEQVLATPNIKLKSMLSNLEIVYLNGEVVTMSLRKSFYETLPNVKLINDYSISECHDVCTFDLAEADPQWSKKYASVGCPMFNVNIYVLNEQMEPVPFGCVGEIYVGGDSVALDYLDLPEKTAERFLLDTFKNDGSRMFRTGDAGRILPNGQLEITGRVEFMIKLRGYTIVLGAIEAVLMEHPSIHSTVVLTENNPETNQPEYLLAYMVKHNAVDDDELLIKEVREFLKERVASYAIPRYFIILDSIPLNDATGKVDHKKLPKLKDIIDHEQDHVQKNIPNQMPHSLICSIWKEILGVEPQDVSDNFFDLGGHSLLAIQLVEMLASNLGKRLSVIDIFEHPTLEQLANYIKGSEDEQFENVLNRSKAVPLKPLSSSPDIAIIGVACHFPGAKDPDAFWNMLSNGGCSIQRFSELKLHEKGIPKSVYTSPNYVKAGAVIDDVDLFDTKFWGISEKEARLIDPQHRLFLQSSWEALENAGYAPSSKGPKTGVFAGCYLPSYLLHYLGGGGILNLEDPAEFHLTETGNDKDYLTTRVSYQLNCHGPSINVQTSCSTALVAVATACQFLQTNQCELAIAGASSITFPQAGYQYQEGHVLSPDGICRAFDASANGTILGDGVGVVILRRLEDAIEAGDQIKAVIKGFAINNDGDMKASYSSPSVSGQMRVVTQAQTVADIAPESITYVEGHGTGTLIGDPIEVRALTKVFQASTTKKQFCALGSVKPNIGHSNIAAGMASLVKVILSLKNKQIPPMINYNSPNPEMQLENGPFFINKELLSWQHTPRRAGVSCFGIGGTNCHMILEEFNTPNEEVRDTNEKQNELEPRQQYLITLSAKTASSLDETRHKFIRYFQLQQSQSKPTSLKDITYTLHMGRENFQNRLAVVCEDSNSAIEGLKQWKSNSLQNQRTPLQHKTNIVFMFPGQGSQYLNMGKEIYKTEHVYRKHFEECQEYLQRKHNIDIYSILFATENQTAKETLNITCNLQTCLFTVEYALAKLLITWGIVPDIVLGHSIGEYVAACIAGVFNLETALDIIVLRAHAMEQVNEGQMLSAKMTENEANKIVAAKQNVWLSALNSPNDVVFSGTPEAISQLEKDLQNADTACRKVHVNRPFHSPLMKPAADRLTSYIANVKMNEAKIPMMANLNGSWFTEQDALNGTYWSEQMCQPVKFVKNVEILLKTKPKVCIEVGPSHVLKILVSQSIQANPNGYVPTILSTLPHPKEISKSASSFLLHTVRQLWLDGTIIDWENFHKFEKCNRMPLPTYSFAKHRCWPENLRTVGQPLGNKQENKKMLIENRFFVPSWTKAPVPAHYQKQQIAGKWLMFLEASGAAGELNEILASHIESCGGNVQRVYRSDQVIGEHQSTTVLNPNKPLEYELLMEKLIQSNQFPDRILYAWSLGYDKRLAANENALTDSYYHMLYLSQALVKVTDSPLMIWVLSQKMFKIFTEDVVPSSAMLLGPAIVLTQENFQITCRVLDVEVPITNQSGTTDNRQMEMVTKQVLTECLAMKPTVHPAIALHFGGRWVEHFEPIVLDEESEKANNVAVLSNSVYIITGGLGRIGMNITESLSKLKCKIILTTRSQFPSKAEWKIISAGKMTSTPYLRKAIKQLLMYESYGAEIHVIQMNTRIQEDVSMLLSETLKHFDHIDGIFHAAGVANLKYLDEMKNEISEQEFESKIYGVLNFEQALSKIPPTSRPEFVVLFSSMASVLGGFGMAAYTGANRFMDAFVQSKGQSNDRTKWICINWDDWLFEYGKEQTAAFEKTVKQFSMTPEEGIESLKRILNYTTENMQVLVTTRPLDARVEQWLHQRNEATSGRDMNDMLQNSASNTALWKMSQANGVSSPVRKSVDFSQMNGVSPDEEEAGEEPMNMMEQQVSNIYKSVLGVRDVSLDDNFFDLGGDSLLAAQIMLQIQKKLQGTRKMQLRKVFECPTIRSLSDWLGQTSVA